jgi:hypothetical protein
MSPISFAIGLHNLCPHLSLSLFMFWIRANNSNDIFPLDYFAPFADSSDRRPDFHRPDADVAPGVKPQPVPLLLFITLNLLWQGQPPAATI